VALCNYSNYVTITMVTMVRIKLAFDVQYIIVMLALLTWRPCNDLENAGLQPIPGLTAVAGAGNCKFWTEF